MAPFVQDEKFNGRPFASEFPHAMKKICCALLMGALALPTLAADLFKGGKPEPFEKGAPLEPSSTFGGYPIYQGDGGWRISDVRSTMSDARGEADAVNMGTLVVTQNEPNNAWFASMAVTINLSSGGLNAYWTGSPCGGNHLVAVNKGKGKNDNCLTVDVSSFQQGTRFVSYFKLLITQGESAGRRYVTQLSLNAELLGFRETAPGDWSVEAVQKAPNRKAFTDRLQQWAESLQDASERALAFSKPQDAFVQVPSYRSLMPVSNGLAHGGYSKNSGSVADH
jgi:hypothetical protein